MRSCRRCGSTLPLPAKFCPRCGARWRATVRQRLERVALRRDLRDLRLRRAAAFGTLRETLYRGEVLAAESLQAWVAELDHVIEAKRREMSALEPTSIDLPGPAQVPEPSPPPDEGTPPLPAPVPEAYPPPDEATPPSPDPVPEPGPQE